MRRFVCLLAAVFFAVGSAAAWDAESFVGLDDPLYYDLPPVVSSAALSPSASDSSGTRVTSWDASWSATAVRYYYSRLRFNTGTSITYYDVPSVQHREWQTSRSGVSFPDIPAEGFSPSFPAATWSDNNVDRWYGPNAWTDLQLSLEVPLSTDATVVSLGLHFPGISFAMGRADNYRSVRPSSISLFVNDQLIRSYSGPSVTEQDILFSDSSPISSIRVVFDWSDSVSISGQPYTFLPVAIAGNVYSGATSYYGVFHSSSDAYLDYAFLSSDGVLDGWNDEAQDNLNKHEEYESQWVGTMTENFNNLHLSDFTFPVGLVSGFSLLTGIFQDLWNGMGEYRILYVFPLTLAVVLLLIGRLAKDIIKGSQRAPKNKGGGPRA